MFKNTASEVEITYRFQPVGVDKEIEMKKILKVEKNGGSKENNKDLNDEFW